MKLVFSRHIQNIQNSAGDLIILSPARDSWNDFGVNAIIDVVIVLNGKVKFNARTKAISIAFPGQSLTSAAGERLEQGRVDLDGIDFVSAFQEIDVYRKIVSALGSRNAWKALSLLRDAPYAKTKASPPGWLRRAERLPQFHEILLRNSEAHFAFLNFRSVTSSRGESLDLASESIDLAPETGSIRAHSLKFRWRSKSTVPRRFNVLVGPNGTGKTHALHSLIRSLVGGRPCVTAHDRGARPVLSRLIFIGTTGDRSASRVKAPAIPYFRIATPSNLSRRSAEVFANIVRSTNSIALRTRADIVIDALDTIFQSDDLTIVCAEGSWGLRELYARYKGSSEQAGLKLVADISNGRVAGRSGARLSSGHDQYIWMLFNVCANIENGSLVLIDEPERHLHPSLISQFISILNSILEGTGSFAILATHSAYFVREVPADCVLVMRPSGDGISVGNPSLQTFGADIGSISYFIFEDELIARMLADVARTITVDGATDEYLKDVSVSARMALEKLI